VTEPVLFVIGLLLLIFDLTLVAARGSLQFTSLGRLLAQRDGNEPKVNRTLALIHSTPRLQASLGLALTVLRFLLAGLLLNLVSLRAASVSFAAGAGFLFLTGLLLYWLEWMVQWYVLRNSETWALRLAPFARGLMFLMAPLVALPLSLSGGMKSVPEGSGAITEDELKTMVDAGQEEGLLELGERRMIYSIFELGDTLAREIMVPRIDIIAWSKHAPGRGGRRAAAFRELAGAGL
jgi:CBS domain containing-hemolysin-like protein